MKTQRNRRTPIEKIQYDTLKTVKHFEEQGFTEVPRRFIALRLNERHSTVSKRLERYDRFHGWIATSKHEGFKVVHLTEKGQEHLDNLRMIFE